MSVEVTSRTRCFQRNDLGVTKIGEWGTFRVVASCLVAIPLASQPVSMRNGGGREDADDSDDDGVS